GGSEPGEEDVNCRIIFVSNGATVHQITVAKGELIPLAEAPAEEKLTPPVEGESFLYWYRGTKATPWDFDTDLVSGNITLTAHWGLKDPEDPEDPNKPTDPPAAILPVSGNDAISLSRSGDYLTLLAPAPISSLQLSDLTGRLLLSQTESSTPSPSAASSLTLPLSSLPRGAYILLVKTPQGAHQFKFIR
ncbi:MAG: InlB B-repeat-containing protein, partial [Tannerellaceae bacterium]|nr:InlB B-repeat-containing protein [Tannerellaceae bacterium]